MDMDSYGNYGKFSADPSSFSRQNSGAPGYGSVYGQHISMQEPKRLAHDARERGEPGSWQHAVFKQSEGARRALAGMSHGERIENMGAYHHQDLQETLGAFSKGYNGSSYVRRRRGGNRRTRQQRRRNMRHHSRRNRK